MSTSETKTTAQPFSNRTENVYALSREAYLDGAIILTRDKPLVFWDYEYSTYGNPGGFLNNSELKT